MTTTQTVLREQIAEAAADLANALTELDAARSADHFREVDRHLALAVVTAINVRNTLAERGWTSSQDGA